MTGLNAGALREALIDAMDLGGAFGQNLHESKDVLVQVGDEFWHLGKVKAAFRNGRFALVLEAGEPDVPMSREEAERVLAALREGSPS